MHKAVLSNESTARVNNSISVPTVLYDNQGRQFPIVKWLPKVVTGEAVVIKAKMFVEIEEQDA